MLICLGAAAAICTGVVSGAPQADKLRVYPALSHGGVAYAIRVGPDGRIRGCRPIDGAPAEADSAAACAALTAIGVPAGITPAFARGDLSKWVTDKDYPPQAFRERREGQVYFIYEVDESGRVAGCITYKSSGTASLDQAACAAIMAHARFTPATYRGQPVRAFGVSSFTFSIPS